MPLDLAAVRAVRPQNPLHYFTTIDSTMIEASRLAKAGEPHGTIVVAEEQTAGLGRLGRSWISEREAGIYSSIVLRLPIAPAQLPVVSLLLGLATAEAIHKSTSLTCDLRWPNDVLVEGRKVAGVLAHLLEDCIVAGIGINVNNTSFASTLRTPASSLRLSSGTQIPREAVLVELLKAIDYFCALLLREGAETIIRAFTAASSYVLDRRVAVEEDGRQGRTAGLDENGFLLLQLDTGPLQRVASGGIRLA